MGMKLYTQPQLSLQINIVPDLGSTKEAAQFAKYKFPSLFNFELFFTYASLYPWPCSCTLKSFLPEVSLLVSMDFFFFHSCFVPTQSGLLNASFALLFTPTMIVTGNLKTFIQFRSPLLFQSRVEDEHIFSQILITLWVMLPNKDIDLLNTLPKSSWPLGSCTHQLLTSIPKTQAISLPHHFHCQSSLFILDRLPVACIPSRVGLLWKFEIPRVSHYSY